MISDNINRVLFQIKEAALRSGRDYFGIKLVSASKYVDSNKIHEAFLAGIRIFGENKVQDAGLKQNLLKDLDIEWHMIGHLQSNKSKEAVRIFNLIHSVDSLDLSKEINKQASRINKIQDILLEINITQEKQKYGINPAEALGLVKEIMNLKSLSLRGLMTMGKLIDNPEDNRIYFKRLRQLFEEINHYLLKAKFQPLSILSMGMSNDFEVAIEEGANLVRIGRAIWGE